MAALAIAGFTGMFLRNRDRFGLFGAVSYLLHGSVGSPQSVRPGSGPDGGPVELMLSRSTGEVRGRAGPSTARSPALYGDPEWGRMFTVLHEQLNEHFTDHQWAGRDQ